LQNEIDDGENLGGMCYNGPGLKEVAAKKLITVPRYKGNRNQKTFNLPVTPPFL
jgi:hypothetical protein